MFASVIVCAYSCVRVARTFHHVALPDACVAFVSLTSAAAVSVEKRVNLETRLPRWGRLILVGESALAKHSCSGGSGSEAILLLTVRDRCIVERSAAAVSFVCGWDRS